MCWQWINAEIREFLIWAIVAREWLLGSAGPKCLESVCWETVVYSTAEITYVGMNLNIQLDEKIFLETS